jgi:hypothetical protein
MEEKQGFGFMVNECCRKHFLLSVFIKHGH